MANEPTPTGTCWCGCGEQTGSGSYFAPGHDRRGEAALIRLEYGSVARLLEAHGYGPEGKNLMEALRDRLPH
jgi:hypothetical protein